MCFFITSFFYFLIFLSCMYIYLYILHSFRVLLLFFFHLPLHHSYVKSSRYSQNVCTVDPRWVLPEWVPLLDWDYGLAYCSEQGCTFVLLYYYVFCCILYVQTRLRTILRSMKAYNISKQVKVLEFWMETGYRV